MDSQEGEKKRSEVTMQMARARLVEGRLADRED